MAATRTRNAFRSHITKVALHLCADAARQCGQLGEAAMVTTSILWALVICLFAIEGDQPNERNDHHADEV